ncbi:CLUMA_CG003581, isoform A [Clunio marinus]|uniref:CLUMA_CG003581, isoform A n=1 Tax=Clunio marinus TaxID=568069 RepID=A0A1J1HT72_9DIPT|nr:CLUMA_CG003581, isoform A [Clunio marinus]
MNQQHTINVSLQHYVKNHINTKCLKATSKALEKGVDVDVSDVHLRKKQISLSKVTVDKDSVDYHLAVNSSASWDIKY